MNAVKLQAGLDQVLATSLQRVVLMLVSVVSIVAASAAIAGSTEFADTWVVFVVAFIACVVAAEPDEVLGLLLMGIVLFHWALVGDDLTTPWMLAFAGCLHVFHTTVALMAVTPHTADVHRDVFVRWTARSMVVAGSTVGVWVLVVAFERQQAPGNLVLSVMALAVLAAAVVGFRARSVPDPS